MSSFFKGWAIPGAPVPGSVEPESYESLDALSGHFRIFQLRDGHRFSTDDLLTAWYGTLCAPASRKVLDLGSGIGSVGMVAAWRLPFASFVTVEAQEASVALAKKSARYNGIENRYEIREGDFRSGVLKSDEKFDLILGSPPYFPEGTGIQSEHPQKNACRFELRGDVSDYCLVAAPHLEMGGVFACVFPMDPPHQLIRVIEGARGAGLSILRYRPVILREGEAPLLAVFAMMRSEHIPEKIREQPWVESPLLIRQKDGHVSPEYMRVKMSIGFPP